MLRYFLYSVCYRHGRFGLRFIATLVVFVIGMLAYITSFCFPIVIRLKVMSFWMRSFLFGWGIRLTIDGSFLQKAPVLLVANHLSWLDIVVIKSMACVKFIAKDELINWPVVGWFAKKEGTLFIRPHSAHSLRAVLNELKNAFGGGEVVSVFPEAGVGNGKELGDFHSAFIGLALKWGVPVVPVAIQYYQNNQVTMVAHYYGAISLWRSFLNVLWADQLEIKATVFYSILGKNHIEVTQAAYELIRNKIAGISAE